MRWARRRSEGSEPHRSGEQQGTEGPTKVLQLVTDRDRRGAQVFAMDLAEGLRHLGFIVETVALTAGRHGDLLPIDALGPSRRSLITLRALRSRARDNQVVIAHGSTTLFACAVSLAFGGTPFLYRQISDPLFWASRWSRRIRVAGMIRRAAAIVALSNTTRTVLRNHYWLQDDRITVIPNAVPVGNFERPSEGERERARRRFGLSESALVFTYVGALAEEKGVDLVVECARSLNGPTALIVGDGPERARLEDLASTITEGRCCFTGPLVGARDAYIASDVVVLPSRGGDSMPAVLIEAGLCGIPAVSTPVGAIPDVVVDGKTGTIVRIGDGAAFTRAVSVMLSDNEFRSSVGAAALERCSRRFTIEATAPLWGELIRKVTKG